MRIVRLDLLATADVFRALGDFYRSLGFGVSAGTDGAPEVRAGYTVVTFSPHSGTASSPFYHFAFRVPRNRFAAARARLERETPLLSDPDTTETTFEFASWNATACYAHDPAGNIVELIAHHELPDEGPEDGPFSAREVLGVCEIGLVGPNVPEMGRTLKASGVKLWDGALEPGRLAFMGGRDGVLILAPAGRGWVPTRRPAEDHRVVVTVQGDRQRDIALPGTEHVVFVERSDEERHETAR